MPLSSLCYGRLLCFRNSLKRNDEPEKASRPYDKNRDGMVISEGGASIVIEELNHALDRGANIYAEVVSMPLHARRKMFIERM